MDQNHGQIKAAFTKLGCKVFDLSGVGKGMADILVNYKGALQLVEIKRPVGTLTEAQERFHKEWPVSVVRDTNGAAMVVMMLREKAWK